MSYTIESFTEKIIHNANEKIVVGVNNEQIITGKKIFSESNIPNQDGSIYIGTLSDNKGAFILSSSHDSSAGEAAGILRGSGSIEL